MIDGLPAGTDGDGAHTKQRTRCLACYRPVQLCFCDAIPRVVNRTDVCILQHRRERFHPFNTARIVNHSLVNCQLLVGHNQDLASRFDALSLDTNVGLLFPHDDAPLLSEVPSNEQPRQIIVPDGTWHHVKTLMRDIPRLQTLPRYRLAPTTPGQYRIRREPNEHALSTLEATVSALQSIEPETQGWDDLLNAFDRMVTDQLKHPTSNWRANSRRRVGSPNVPRALLGAPDNIVVAYGEHEFGQPGQHERRSQSLPVAWTAVRWASGQVFRCIIQSDSLRDSAFRDHLRLADDAIESAVTRELFLERWRAFLQHDDQVVVRLPSTAALLRRSQADFVPTIILKSIDVPSEHLSRKNLDLRFDRSVLLDGSRASERLSQAVDIVTSIRHHYPAT